MKYREGVTPSSTVVVSVLSCAELPLRSGDEELQGGGRNEERRDRRKEGMLLKERRTTEGGKKMDGRKKSRTVMWEKEGRKEGRFL
jgi:hypothetical protein